MGSYFRIRAWHGAYLAIYQPSGVVCAVAGDKLGGAFKPLFLYKDEAFAPGIAVLVGEAPATGFFIRPYVVGNRAIPIKIEDQSKPGRISFAHPGVRYFVTAEPTHAMEHFAAIAANRERNASCESFPLEPVQTSTVPDSVQTLIKASSFMYEPKRTLVDLYSQFGCDALAAKGDTTELAAVVSSFESLGDNCEFGITQRKCLAEPLGFLRFGGGLNIHGVIAGLRDRFESIGHPENMTCTLSGGQWNISDKSCKLTYHTWRVEKLDPEVILDQEIKKLRYLRGKILEDLEDNAKIFVFKSNRAPPLDQLVELLGALRSYGNTTLLSVVGSDPDHPPGTVVPIADGLLRGYIDRFVPYVSSWDVLSVPCWIRICRNAYALWQAAS